MREKAVAISSFRRPYRPTRSVLFCVFASAMSAVIGQAGGGDPDGVGVPLGDPRPVFQNWVGEVSVRGAEGGGAISDSRSLVIGRIQSLCRRML